MRRKILASLLITPLLGCAGTTAPDRARDAPAATGNGYALLYVILEQERQVSKLLYIKEETQALETVIDAIAETCGAAYDRLAVLSAEIPQLDLSDTGLPGDEIRTRQAIAATRRDQLLAASGSELQMQLLLSQNEALTYMTHLADTLARREPDPVRLAYVRTLWQDLTRRLENVQALLRDSARAGG